MANRATIIAGLVLGLLLAFVSAIPDGWPNILGSRLQRNHGQPWQQPIFVDETSHDTVVTSSKLSQKIRQNETLCNSGEAQWTGHVAVGHERNLHYCKSWPYYVDFSITNTLSHRVFRESYNSRDCSSHYLGQWVSQYGKAI
jgi:hypothetical protein